MGNKITLNKAINKTLDMVENSVKVVAKATPIIIDTGLEVAEIVGKGTRAVADSAKECWNQSGLKNGHPYQPVNNYPRANEIKEEESLEETVEESFDEHKFTPQEIEDIVPVLEKLNNIYSKI